MQVFNTGYESIPPAASVRIPIAQVSHSFFGQPYLYITGIDTRWTTATLLQSPSLVWLRIGAYGVEVQFYKIGKILRKQ